MNQEQFQGEPDFVTYFEGLDKPGRGRSEPVVTQDSLQSSFSIFEVGI